MAENIKIRTEDVSEILDTKIKTDSAHLALGVASGEFYDSVLEKISERSPTFDEKAALTAAENPSALNPYTTLSRLNTELAGRIPWVSVGPSGSGADFEGNSQAPLVNAILFGAKWITLRPGQYTFEDQVEVPADTFIMGASQGSCVIKGNIDSPLFVLSGENITLENFAIEQELPLATAVKVESNKIVFSHMSVSATETGKTLELNDDLSDLTFSFSTFNGGVLSGKNTTDVTVNCCKFDTTATYAIDLESPSRFTLFSSTMLGQLYLKDASNSRILGNHLNDGIFNESPVSVTLRGNTPVTINNESEDFVDLLQYIGSPSVQDSEPQYSNNYAGPQGQSLTARAGALDLLTQWRFEERNFHLVGAVEPSYVIWDSLNRTLSTTSNLHLVSSHRDALWVIPQLGTWTDLIFASQQASSQTLTINTATQRLGQSFVSPYTGDLTKITLRLRKSSGATGSIRLTVYRAGINHKPDGSALSNSSTVNLNTILTSDDDVEFNFTTPLRLENGTSYTLVVTPVSAISGILYLAINPSPGSYTGGSVVQSADGGASWDVISQDFRFKVEGTSLSTITLNDDEALYYKFDRNITAENVTLAPYIAPLGTIPNDAENRNVFVLAYCHNGTIWWRGGNGTRLPATGNEIAQYHIDGTSKALVDYIGAQDTNDNYPEYLDNFCGLAAEPLVQRISKIDSRLRTLYEYSNLMVEIESGGKLELEGDELKLTGNLYFYFPHLKARFFISPKSWTITQNTSQIIYASWDQSALSEGVSIAATNGVITNGTLPMPENDGRNKYVILARRIGTTVQLWDGSELISGSQWPVPSGGRFIIPSARPTLLDQNIMWDGQNLLWESIGLVTADGLPVERNMFPNRVLPLPGLTNLSPSEGLLVTHTWNAGANAQVQIQKVSLPVSNLRQNQFIWVQNHAGTLVFGI